MDTPIINTLSLCSGVGMLDLGVELACEYHGHRTRVLAYAERETSAAATLLARMEGKSLESAPIWCGSLEELPLDSLRGKVDAVVAGFPCPDFSVAGKQAGTEGERYLLPAILEIARDVGARWLFLENVRGIFSAGDGAAFAEIQRTLSDFGWNAEWTTLRASEVGANHRRERWFCVAYRDTGRCEQRDEGFGEPAKSSEGQSKMGNAPCGENLIRESGGVGRSKGRRGSLDASASDAGGAVANSESERGQRGGLSDECVEPGQAFCDAERAGEGVADACSQRQEGRERDGAHEHEGSTSHGSTSECGSLPIFAPGPSDRTGWQSVVDGGSIEYLAPAIKPGVRVLVDGVALVVDESRADQLRAGGNGVVPLQAAVAFTHLLRRINTFK